MCFLLGVDTASIDYGPSKDFWAHRILYESNKIGLENLNNLKQLPPKGARVTAFPMKIEDGSGAPCRVIAEIYGDVHPRIRGSWLSWLVLVTMYSLIITVL